MFNVPLTSLVYKVPDDGFPLLPSWRMTASDIFFSGYQSLREPMEVKELERSSIEHGRPTSDWQTAAWRQLCDFSYQQVRHVSAAKAGVLFFN